MKKQEFLNELRERLNGLPPSDLDDRISFYGEMIDDHQTELCKKLSEEGYLVDGTFDMYKAWEQIQDFEPRENDFVCELPNILKKMIDTYLTE